MHITAQKLAEFIAWLGERQCAIVPVGAVALGEPAAAAGDIDIFVGVARETVGEISTKAISLGFHVEAWQAAGTKKGFTGLSIKDLRPGGKARIKVGPAEWSSLQSADYCRALVLGWNAEAVRLERAQHVSVSDPEGKEGAYAKAGIRITKVLIDQGTWTPTSEVSPRIVWAPSMTGKSTFIERHRREIPVVDGDTIVALAGIWPGGRWWEDASLRVSIPKAATREVISWAARHPNRVVLFGVLPETPPPGSVVWVGPDELAVLRVAQATAEGNKQHAGKTEQKVLEGWAEFRKFATEHGLPLLNSEEQVLELVTAGYAGKENRHA